jgi:uncharacterized membrane protein
MHALALAPFSVFLVVVMESSFRYGRLLPQLKGSVRRQGAELDLLALAFISLGAAMVLAVSWDKTLSWILFWIWVALFVLSCNGIRQSQTRLSSGNHA